MLDSRRSMGIKVVDELGSLIEEHWSAKNFDPHRLTDIAVEALREAQLPARLSPDDIVRWALTTTTLPQQRDAEARFGQPPLTLYRARRFYIEALHWIDGSTTLHQHAFSGAFQVLAGSSIETQYRFEAERDFDGHFVMGALHLTSTTFHVPGDIVGIRSGSKGLIHGLFHLERPSITIVVRTFRDGDAGPQFNYTRNGIGVDPFLVDDSRDRSLQLVGMLRSIEHPEFEKMVGDLVARSDLHTAFRVLDACASLPDRTLFDRLLDRVGDRGAVDAFRKAFQESRRLAFLYGRRTLVKNPDLRFLLGVLLNARRRQDALDLVAARISGDSARQTAAWVRKLSELNIKLQAAGIPWQPNVLGLPQMTDELEDVLVRELEGEPVGSDDRAVTFLQQLRALPAFACLFA
jgi:hypothetical protein